MIEYQILKLFCEDKELYSRYYSSLRLSYIRDNYPLLSKLFNCLPVSGLDELEIVYLTKYPVIKEGDREAIHSLINNVRNTDIALESILEYLQGHLTRSLCNDLAQVSLDVKDGKKSLLDLSYVYDRIMDIKIDEVEDEVISTNIEELLATEDNSIGLHWRLKCLNQSLGTLRKGNLGHIFARVETGKTAMWVSEVTFMAQQVTEEHPILILFNEEEGESVMFRLFNAVTGLTYMEIRNSPKEAQKIWDSKIGNRIVFIKEASMVNKKSIEGLLEKYKPSLCIIDNMDKVGGFIADREDLRLHSIYKWGRAMAQKHCAILTVGQASDSATNSKYVSESDMANSKTAKPSELDFIISIGRIEKDGYEDIRFISIPKNKLRGDKNTIEAMRHMKAKEVQLIPTLSIYKDI